MIVMEENEKEYIGSGKSEVDKVYHESLPGYSRDNQTLSVESFFSGTMTIQQIIKQYLTEHKSKIELDDFSKENYNESCNIAVVTSTKEGSK